MKYLFFALVILATFASCKKKDAVYKVEGTITDASFNQPLSNAMVELYEIPLGGANPTTLLATTTTGSDGIYRFDIKREKVESYYIKVYKNLYFGTSISFHMDDLTLDKTNSFTHTVTAQSWVKLHFVNTDADQDLKYIRQSGKSGCTECCTGGEHYLYGIQDTIMYCINDGNTAYSYYYWVLNTANNGPMTVNTTPFDTTELLLNY